MRSNKYTAIVTFLFSAAFIALTTGCSLQSQISGTWQISSFEEISASDNVTSSTNIGTLNFDSDGTGYNNIQVRMLGASNANEDDFTWKAGEDFVRLEGTRETAGADLIKTWIVTESGRSKQIWKSTTNDGSIQILKLTKEK